MNAVPEYKQAYVFAPIGKGEISLAGNLKITNTSGTFTYADEWLENAAAYALDPINLPLAPKTFTTRSRKRVHGVFCDAAPDAWGERIMLLQHKSAPKNELERLLRLSGTGVGGLEFSLSRSKVRLAAPLPDIGLLERLSKAIDDLSANILIDDTELKLLEPGSSMGGARPKVTLYDLEGRCWLVKFSRADDIASYPQLEYATMSLLKNVVGLNVPEVKLYSISRNKKCYFIERFDRRGEPCHFISAYSLFNQDRLRGYESGYDDPAGYIALAGIIRRVSSKAIADCEELFKRMVCAILLGNTDDHSRNYGMVYSPATGEWRLSPHYDVMPIISSQGLQSMSVGKTGRASTLVNAMSAAEAFGLSVIKAKTIIDDLTELISAWRPHFEHCGVSAVDIELVAQVIETQLRK